MGGQSLTSVITKEEEPQQEAGEPTGSRGQDRARTTHPEMSVHGQRVVPSRGRCLGAPFPDPQRQQRAQEGQLSKPSRYLLALNSHLSAEALCTAPLGAHLRHPRPFPVLRPGHNKPCRCQEGESSDTHRRKEAITTPSKVPENVIKLRVSLVHHFFQMNN